MSRVLTGVQATLADIVDLGTEAVAAVGLLVVDRVSHTVLPKSHDEQSGITVRTPDGEAVRTAGSGTTVVSITADGVRHDRRPGLPDG